MTHCCALQSDRGGVILSALFSHKLIRNSNMYDVTLYGIPVVVC